MPLTCPHCGQPYTRPKDALRALFPALSGVGVTGQPRFVLEALAQSYPRGLTREALTERLYWDHPDGGPVYADRIVPIAVLRLRRSIASSGWTITDGRKGRAYRLVRTERSA